MILEIFFIIIAVASVTGLSKQDMIIQSGAGVSDSSLAVA